MTGWSPDVSGVWGDPIVCGVDQHEGVDPEHCAEVELTREDQAVRGWRVRCVCAWTGVWRASLCDAVAEYDEHLADYGIFVADGAWWSELPCLVPVTQVPPDAVALGAACRIWAVEAVDRLDRLCRWAVAMGDGAQP